MDNRSESLELINSVRTQIEEFWARKRKYDFDASNPVVRLHEPTFGPDEISAALEVLLSTYVTQGKRVQKFEKQFSDYTQTKYGVMNNSGSSANLLAISGLVGLEEGGLRPGDEVIVPALSWSTTVWPLVQCGLVPVIVDIDPKTLNIDPDMARDAIGPKTRGLMPVHVYGNPCDMNALLDISKSADLVLIEDCCEALGAKYHGKPVGSFGEVGTFSFYFSHHIATLEGGITVTNNFELAEMMRIQRAHGWIREVEDKERYRSKHPEIDERFLFVNHGYNLRATELQGAMGSIQLPKLKTFVTTRSDNANFWVKEFEKYSESMEIQSATQGSEHTWFGIAVTVSDRAKFTASEIRDYLEHKNIETRPIICGNIAAQPAMKLFKHRVHGTLENATRVMRSGFSFGNHQFIDKDHLAYMADAISKFMEKKR
jgi:CDP-6-deoxy-D-xylo-4-hexulose-3-dehydrase